MSDADTRTVRRGRESDIPRIAELINLAFEIEKDFVRGERTTVADLETMAKHGSFLVVDHADGSLAATLHLSIRGPVGGFSMLSVHPDLQGHGLGRRMVAVAELVCEAEGCDRVQIEVVSAREELIPFYQRLSYTKTGTRPFPHNDDLLRPVHFLVFEKRLEPALQLFDPQAM